MSRYQVKIQLHGGWLRETDAKNTTDWYENYGKKRFTYTSKQLVSYKTMDEALRMLVQFTGHIGRVAGDVLGQNIFSNNLFFVVKSIFCSVYVVAPHAPVQAYGLSTLRSNFLASYTGFWAGLVDLIIRKRFNFSQQFRKESTGAVNPLCHVGGSLRVWAAYVIKCLFIKHADHAALGSSEDSANINLL